MKEDFDDSDASAELYFEPAVSVTGSRVESDGATRPANRARGLRRRVMAGAVLIGALASMGGAYAAFAATSGAGDTTNSAQDVAAGKQLYETSCITCHGANLQGVHDRGVALVGAGSAAVYFQVTTGRMPLTGQGAEADRKTPKFTEQQAEQLAAYIQSIGGGPQLPQGSLRANDQMAQGGDLFRLNCAACHGVTGKGAPLSAGKQAPSLNHSTDEQLYAAMLTGPESMPIFGDNQVTPEQKRAIISYVQALKASKDPGGNGIDRIGPVSEAVVIWVAGVGAIMVAILWIGVKNQ